MPTAQPTRDRILDAAERLFFHDGIATTGVDRVATEAGVAIVTLYKHVGSKDNLLREVLARRLDSWIEHWDAAVAATDTPESGLLAVFDAVETFRASAGPAQWCCFLATASERPAPPEGTDDPVFDLVRQDTSLVIGRLTDLARRARPEQADEVAAMMLVLYNGVLASLLRGLPTDPVTHAKTLARSLLDVVPLTAPAGTRAPGAR